MSDDAGEQPDYVGRSNDHHIKQKRQDGEFHIRYFCTAIGSRYPLNPLSDPERPELTPCRTELQGQRGHPFGLVTGDPRMDEQDESWRSRLAALMHRQR